MSRVGIELGSAALRGVEIDGAINGGRETRVRSFVVLPRSGPDADAWLRSLKRSTSAAVVVWGAGAEHRQVVVSNGSYPRMRTEALQTATSAGVATRGMLADITGAALAVKDARRQPVVLALANAQKISEAVQPLVDAGLRIKSVMTPADALLVLARARQAFAAAGAIEAYVALDETATCLALIRNGALVSARELRWGYGGTAPSVAAGPPGRRDDLAERLASALQHFVVELGAGPNAIGQVTICGGLPELRTMAVPLMERLDVEVDTLDSLFGIETSRLPQPEDLFCEHLSELRLAWAAVADEKPPIDLLRSRRYRNVRAVVQRAAIAAVIVAAVALGWGITTTRWWRTTPQAPSTAVTRPAAAPVAPPRSASPTPAKPAPLVPARPTLAPTPAVPRPSPPVPEIPPAVLTARPNPPAVAPAQPIAPTVRTPPPIRPAAPPQAAPARTRPEPPPTPLDATLGTILYSADRKLAVIDGRIVGIGDVVRGARVTDITPTLVLLRDANGRPRSLALGNPVR